MNITIFAVFEIFCKLLNFVDILVVLAEDVDVGEHSLLVLESQVFLGKHQTLVDTIELMSLVEELSTLLDQILESRGLSELGHLPQGLHVVNHSQSSFEADLFKIGFAYLVGKLKYAIILGLFVLNVLFTLVIVHLNHHVKLKHFGVGLKKPRFVRNLYKRLLLLESPFGHLNQINYLVRIRLDLATNCLLWGCLWRILLPLTISI